MDYQILSQAFDEAIKKWVNFSDDVPVNECVILDIESKDCKYKKNFQTLVSINENFTHYRMFKDKKSGLISSLPSKIYRVEDDYENMRFAICCKVPKDHIPNIWKDTVNEIKLLNSSIKELQEINQNLVKENYYLKTVIEQQQNIMNSHYQTPMYQAIYQQPMYQQPIVYYTENAIEL